MSVLSLKNLVAVPLLACAAMWAAPARAQLVVLAEYAPGLGGLVGLGFDHTRGHLWLYSSFGTELRGFSSGGDLAAIPRPGEPANDADIEIASVPLSLAGTSVPAGSVLFANGETGVAEVYAVDRSTGVNLATLTTGFGTSHVVGLAYHPTRRTLFLVQDRVPGGANANLVAEVDPDTGAVLNSFQISSFFSVNYGDIDVVRGTGNLLAVSSDESRIVEFTPTGTLVRYYPLPTGVAGLSGIGFDDKRSEAWVSSSNGRVWRLGQSAESRLEGGGWR